MLLELHRVSATLPISSTPFLWAKSPQGHYFWAAVQDGLLLVGSDEIAEYRPEVYRSGVLRLKMNELVDGSEFAETQKNEERQQEKQQYRRQKQHTVADISKHTRLLELEIDKRLVGKIGEKERPEDKRVI